MAAGRASCRGERVAPRAGGRNWLATATNARSSPREALGTVHARDRRQGDPHAVARAFKLLSHRRRLSLRQRPQSARRVRDARVVQRAKNERDLFAEKGGKRRERGREAAHGARPRGFAKGSATGKTERVREGVVTTSGLGLIRRGEKPELATAEEERGRGTRGLRERRRLSV